MLSINFFITNILLGVGLAMDAFSVSLANGLNEPKMKAGRMNLMAGTFAFYQWFMPMAGWICVHTVLNYFRFFEKLIPWIALALLVYIGGKMLIEGVRNKDGNSEDSKEKVGFKVLMIQGIATSIDALSVGFTIAEYNLAMALIATVIIAAVTYFICMAGLIIGKKFGTKLAGKASILGGVILIGIGIEIFVKGIFF